MTYSDHTAHPLGNATELERAIAMTVADALTAAATPGADVAAWSAARDAAQLMSMEGLDHALAACSAHVGSSPPPDVAALADRLARVAQTVREAGSLEPLREMDAELNSLAGELNSYEWVATGDGEAERRASVAALNVTDVLEDAILANDESRAAARRSRLPIPVAAAVRAAVDWLSPASGVLSVRLHGEPSLLEIRFDRIRTDRLYAVHRVIAAAGGNLGPMSDGDGWVLRVPSFAERPTYLMIVQGGLRIAVPWHSVLKLRIVSAAWVSGGMWPADHPVLPAFAPAALETGEHPVMLIGHGLKRAYLAADRLIWRMAAEACPNEWGSPAMSLVETVRTEDGEVFWVVDPSRLLADVELPDLAVGPDPESLPVVLSEANVQPLELVSLVPPAPPPSAMAPEPAATAPSLVEPEAAGPNVLEPEPAPVARALVADDSLTTRLLLARLLEQRGFTVDTVSTSAELIVRLNDSAWTLLFTDLELPDGGGLEWVRQVRRIAASRPHPVRVIALIRDGGDLDVARAAGIEDSLLKPFARASLGALLARHSLGRP